MDRGMDQDQVWLGQRAPLARGLPTMGRPVIHHPEDLLTRAVGFRVHPLVHESPKWLDPGCGSQRPITYPRRTPTPPGIATRRPARTRMRWRTPARERVAGLDSTESGWILVFSSALSMCPGGQEVGPPTGPRRNPGRARLYRRRAEHGEPSRPCTARVESIGRHKAPDRPPAHRLASCLVGATRQVHQRLAAQGLMGVRDHRTRQGFDHGMIQRGEKTGVTPSPRLIRQ